MLAGTVDDFSISNLDNVDDQVIVANLVDNSIVALPQAVELTAGQFLTSRWSRFIRQALNPSNDALSVFLDANGLKLLDRRRLYQDPIFFHFA